MTDILLPPQREVEFLAQLKVFKNRAEQEMWAVGDVLNFLRTVLPEDEGARSFLGYVTRTIGRRQYT